MGRDALRPPKPEPKLCKCGQPSRVWWQSGRQKWQRRNECNACAYKRRKENSAKEFYREHNYKSKYGITVEEYEALAEKQNHRCAICGTEECATGKRLAVDHCHKTNKVRGLLCFHCNSGLGKFGDNVNTVVSAAAYLQEHT